MIHIKNINKVYGAMCKALQKIYIGNGLYIDIDRISLMEPQLTFEEYVDGNHGEEFERKVEYYEIEGRYGRYDEHGDPDLNFSENFTMTYQDDDSEDFIQGMFYQIISSKDFP